MHLVLDTQRQETLVTNMDKLRNANVLILGCGAVGSQVAPVLQRMGVSRFTLIDGDAVEGHNLNRQLFTAAHVGKNKAIAVAANMRAVDPDVKVEVVPSYLLPDDVAAYDFARFTHIIFGADTLWLEKLVWDIVQKMPAPPVFISPRMSGYVAELFTFIPGIVQPKGIYFTNKPDKKYGEGAHCTGPDIPDVKVPAIATTTNILCGLAGQAFVESCEGRAFKDHIRMDLSALVKVPEPAPASA